MKKLKVSRITIGRVYNLGNYENVRYELSVDIGPGESAAAAGRGLSKIINALKPAKGSIKTASALVCEDRRILAMRELLEKHGPEVFQQRQGHFEGTAKQYIKRCADSHREEVKARAEWLKRRAKAVEAFDDLGGTEQWKDHKQDWDDDY